MLPVGKPSPKPPVSAGLRSGRTAHNRSHLPLKRQVGRDPWPNDEHPGPAAGEASDAQGNRKGLTTYWAKAQPATSAQITNNPTALKSSVEQYACSLTIRMPVLLAAYEHNIPLINKGYCLSRACFPPILNLDSKRIIANPRASPSRYRLAFWGPANHISNIAKSCRLSSGRCSRFQRDVGPHCRPGCASSQGVPP